MGLPFSSGETYLMFSQSHDTYYLCCDTGYENSFEQGWISAMNSVNINNGLISHMHCLFTSSNESQWYVYFLILEKNKLRFSWNLALSSRTEILSSTIQNY